jgi:hypothetical protein
LSHFQSDSQEGRKQKGRVRSSIQLLMGNKTHSKCLWRWGTLLSSIATIDGLSLICLLISTSGAASALRDVVGWTRAGGGRSRAGGERAGARSAVGGHRLR